jgi:hypothetical protein
MLRGNAGHAFFLFSRERHAAMDAYQVRLCA